MGFKNIIWGFYVLKIIEPYTAQSSFSASFSFEFILKTRRMESKKRVRDESILSHGMTISFNDEILVFLLKFPLVGNIQC
jgi:hypothetical protein